MAKNSDSDSNRVTSETKVCPVCGAPAGAAAPVLAPGIEKEFGASAETVAHLAWLPTPVTPPPDLKARLLARVRASQAPAVEPGAPRSGPDLLWRFASVRSAADWWRPPVPGVRLKELSADDTTGVALLFVEIEPGQRFPDHVHHGAEFGMVLSGDVTSGGRLLRAGDYYHTASGSSHTDIVSPNGCTALLCVKAESWRAWRGAHLVPAE